MATHPVERAAAHGLRGALASVRTWVWRDPIARAMLLIAGLGVLGIVGHAAGASPEMPARADGASALPAGAVPASALPVAATADAGAGAASPCITSQAPPSAPSRASRSGEATPEDPVILNTASVDDLRRLPGIGAKRAEAILTLRARLGRFRQIEDLMKVRGIGRATLRRLRPLVRVDPPAPS